VNQLPQNNSHKIRTAFVGAASAAIDFSGFDKIKSTTESAFSYKEQ
jgi:hypothetical protein